MEKEEFGLTSEVTDPSRHRALAAVPGACVVRIHTPPAARAAAVGR